jgi:preprotein translocase subunit SecF
LLIPGIISLILWGLNYGIDFKGGSLLELKFTDQSSVSLSEIRQTLNPMNLGGLSVQTAGSNEVILKMSEINQDKAQEIEQTLTQNFGQIQEDSFDTIGPVVSSDLTRKAILSVILASIGIILYIAWAFRKVPAPASSWRFGVAAVAALIHDLLFVTGVFSILGHFFGYEIDTLFITALLTVMGFSVHDTIVVFDRLRENLLKYPEVAFDEIANASVVQTIDRSINTTATVLIVLLSLYLFGGASVAHFVLVLLVGIFIGTYSSIFNATPIVVSWQLWSQRNKK